MKIELVDISETRKELRIEIESDAVREVFDRMVRDLAKEAKIPGFRPGHAPQSVVRSRFRRQIREDVIREMVPSALEDAIISRSLLILDTPEVHIDKPDTGNEGDYAPIRFHAHVEVLPDIKLENYKGLEVERRVRPVTDEDVDRVIAELRETSASLAPVEDRGAEPGDTVTVTFHGKFLNEPEAEDIHVEDVDVTLGEPGVQEEFNQNLAGARPDEIREFSVHYPQDFSSKGLAGKEVAYTATVTAVRRKELPDLDDEWAASLSEEYDSLETLRRRVREDLIERARREADHEVRNALMEKLALAHPIEVPESMVRRQASSLAESFARNMIGRGYDPRALESVGDNVRARLVDQAEEDVRISLLLESLADREDIKVGDDEIEAEINAFAEHSGRPLDEVRSALTKDGGKRSIGHRLRNRKALDLVVENARITDAPWVEGDAGQGGESEGPREPASSATEPHQSPTTEAEVASAADLPSPSSA